mmetsp:Transcript_61074/g.169332  ORF Transcript_61074/g.169332 Transcript_61074/m.169332 type:complete len:205 (-) Transcript_61074:758-1372(-)
MGVALTEGPVAGGEGGAGLPAILLPGGLGGQEQRLREFPVYLRQVVEGIARVPVEGNAGCELAGGGVAVHCLGPQDNGVLVVVVGKDENLGMSGLQCWAEVGAQPRRLLVSGVGAGLPACGVHGLVLRCDGPDGHAVGLVRRDPLDEVIGPRLEPLGQQLAPALHLVAGLHPSRRAPRRSKELQFPPTRADPFHSRPDQGDHRR